MLLYLNILIPVVLKVLVPDGRYGVVTLAVDFLVLPLSLIVLNIFLIQTKVENSLLKCSALMLAGLLLGTVVGYIIWGMTNANKSLLSPDDETLMIFQAILIYQAIVSVVFAGIYKAILMIANK